MASLEEVRAEKARRAAKQAPLASPLSPMQDTYQRLDEVQEEKKKRGMPAITWDSVIARMQGGAKDFGNMVQAPSTMVMGAANAAMGNDPVQAMGEAQEKGTSQYLADKVHDKTNSPALATAMYMLPEIITSWGGGVAAGAPKAALKAQAAKDLASGKMNTDIAKYLLVGSNRVKADKLFEATAKVGWDKGLLTVIKGSKPIDKKNMTRMLDIYQRARIDPKWGLYNRPSDVAGEVLMKRVNLILEKNQAARPMIEKAAQGLKGQRVDFAPAIDKFKANLNDLGIRLDAANNPVFKGSDIEGLKKLENIFTRVITRMKSGEPGQIPDAYDMHRLKRYIDENVIYGKEVTGMSGRVEAVLKGLRHDVDGILDTKFDTYNKVNTQYADTIDALNAIRDAAGRKFDLFSDRANAYLGKEVRKFMSNYGSRDGLIEAVKTLDDTAAKYGGKFDDSVDTLAMFADDLNTTLRPSARTSLQGEMYKETARAAHDAVSGNSKGVLDAAVNVVKKPFAKDPDLVWREQVKALRDYIRQR